MMGTLPRTISWIAERSRVQLVDQRKLPHAVEYLELSTYEEMIDAIKTLAVRGAPALGVAGAYALCLWSQNQSDHDSPHAYMERLEEVAHEVAHARPTAVNLERGVTDTMERLRRTARYLAGPNKPLTLVGDPQLYLEGQAAVASIKAELVALATQLERDDERTNRLIAQHGASLIPDNAGILTHCNAGSLATAYVGTALGVIYEAQAQGKNVHVYADETRPVGQGARLTVWELMQAGIPVTLQCDSMAASLMAQKKISCVIVGADRIANNGDTANKVGTLPLAIAAAYHKVPFYVAAPLSTFDLSLKVGEEIPIELRDPHEVTDAYFDQIPQGLEVYNPSFDVTSGHLVTAFITEKGIVRRQLNAPHYNLKYTLPLFDL